MAEPDIRCDVCGARLKNARMSAELFLIEPGEKRIGPQRHQRNFEGDCPQHGKRIAAFPSEGHSTLLESWLGKLFSKEERRALKDTLEPEERRDFRDALRGQFAWDAKDVSYWKSKLSKLFGRK